MVRNILFEPLFFEGLSNLPNSTNISNNSHTSTFFFDYGNNDAPTVSGGPFTPFTYKFAQMHFHFGENNKWYSLNFL